MIPDSEISVVVQGPIGDNILDNLNSIRKTLPNAEIILSTWESPPPPPSLPVDRIILSKDPGAKPVDKGGVLNNTNRQLVSTLNGLRAAQRRYTLKIRTDFLLVSSNFLDAFGRYQQRDPQFSVFERRVVTPHYAARIPDSRKPYPFHPSDLAQFGLTSDLLNLYDVPRATDEEMTWGLHDQGHRAAKTAYPAFISKYTPEQHFFISFLRKNGKPINCDFFSDNTEENIINSKKYILNNYTIINIDDFGLKPTKFSLANACKHDSDTCYSTRFFEVEYKRHCAPSHKLDLKGKFLSYLTRNRTSYEKMVRHGNGAKKYYGLLFEASHKAIAESITFAFYLIQTLFSKR